MRIVKLDGLRGLFSVMIILYHYQGLLLPSYVYNNYLIRQSFTFVDFFFVLSGFVITYNYNEMSSISEFVVYMKNRFSRLYPLLFFTSIIFFIYRLLTNYVKVLYPEFNLFEAQETINYGVLINQFLECVFFTNSNSILGITTGVNGPSWSISSEMISYLTLGLIVINSSGKKRSYLIGIVLIFSMIFMFFGDDCFSTGKYGFIRGLISFLMGYFVCILSKKKIKIPNIIEFFIPIILVFLFFCLSIYPIGSFNYQLLGIIIPAFFSISILCLIKTQGYISGFLETKFIQFLGKISYSIYLNHALLLLIIPKAVFRIFKIPKTDFSEIIVLLFTILVIAIYSRWTYNVIEFKGSNLLKKFLR